MRIRACDIFQKHKNIIPSRISLLSMFIDSILNLIVQDSKISIWILIKLIIWIFLNDLFSSAFTMKLFLQSHVALEIKLLVVCSCRNTFAFVLFLQFTDFSVVRSQSGRAGPSLDNGTLEITHSQVLNSIIAKIREIWVKLGWTGCRNDQSVLG